jgi:hypothetical protein
MDDYSYLWDGREPGWTLARVEGRFLIYNREEWAALLIEDHDLHEAVVQRMLAAGVEVIDHIADQGPEPRTDGQDATESMRVVQAALGRFFDEGFYVWSRPKLQALLGPSLSLDDPRVQRTLATWASRRFVRLNGRDDRYLEVLRDFRSPPASG